MRRLEGVLIIGDPTATLERLALAQELARGRDVTFLVGSEDIAVNRYPLALSTALALGLAGSSRYLSKIELASLREPDRPRMPDQGKRPATAAEWRQKFPRKAAGLRR